MTRGGPLDGVPSCSRQDDEGAASILAAFLAPEASLLLGGAAALEHAGREHAASASRERARNERRLVEAALDETGAVERYRYPGVVRPDRERAELGEQQRGERKMELRTAFELEPSDRVGERRSVAPGREHGHTVECRKGSAFGLAARGAERRARRFVARGAAAGCDQLEERSDEAR